MHSLGTDYHMSDYHINIFYSEEDGGYIADIPYLESCSAFGDTPEAALAEVERAESCLAGSRPQRFRQADSSAPLSPSDLSNRPLRKREYEA